MFIVMVRVMVYRIMVISDSLGLWLWFGVRIYVKPFFIYSFLILFYVKIPNTQICGGYFFVYHSGFNLILILLYIYFFIIIYLVRHYHCNLTFKSFNPFNIIRIIYYRLIY